MIRFFQTESKLGYTKTAGEVGWAGLEPATNALKGRCSTIELPTRLIFRTIATRDYASATGERF